MREILLKMKIFRKRIIKKVKKLTLFFLSNPVPFNRQSYQNQKGPGTSDQSLFRSQNQFRKIPLLVIYYLSKFDDIHVFLRNTFSKAGSMFLKVSSM